MCEDLIEEDEEDICWDDVEGSWDDDFCECDWDDDDCWNACLG